MVAKNKKGKVDVKNVAGIVVGLVILMSIAAALYPTFSTSASSMNTSLALRNSTGDIVATNGIGTLFAGALVGLVFGAAVLYAVLKGFGVM